MASGKKMRSDRFWVRYGLDGKVVQLYRLSYSGDFFQRWDQGVWVDASDRYERITQDAACDEIGLEQAVSLMKSPQ
jgi:hypothetical protein